MTNIILCNCGLIEINCYAVICILLSIIVLCLIVIMVFTILRFCIQVKIKDILKVLAEIDV